MYVVQTSNFCFFLVKPSSSIVINILHLNTIIEDFIRLKAKVLSRQLLIQLIHHNLVFIFFNNAIAILKEWMKTFLSLIQYLSSNTHSENREKCLNIVYLFSSGIYLIFHQYPWKTAKIRKQNCFFFRVLCLGSAEFCHFGNCFSWVDMNVSQFMFSLSYAMICVAFKGEL